MAKGKKKPASRVRKPAKKPAKAKPAKDGADASTQHFERGVNFAATGFLFDAIGCFRKSAEADAKNALADDAYYNAGLCYFQLGLYHEAAEYFTRVIQGYPRATIHAAAGAKEFGKTAAKAHLGRLRAYLALGRKDDAQKEIDDLNKYPDSYVVDGKGARRTFYELGLEALK